MLDVLGYALSDQFCHVQSPIEIRLINNTYLHSERYLNTRMVEAFKREERSPDREDIRETMVVMSRAEAVIFRGLSQ